MRTDFFNEAIVTAMLVASAPGQSASASPAAPATAEPAPTAGMATSAIPADRAGMAQTVFFGEDGLEHAAKLKEHLSALMDKGARTAVQAGMPNALIEAADFAATAFIDEILLSSPSWTGKGEWLKKPLQFVRHGTATAGEDFFRVLDGLLEEAENSAPVSFEDKDNAEALDEYADENFSATPLHAVLEIYALCLAQGFTGMLYGNPAAIQEKLDRIGHFILAVKQRGEPFFTPPPPPKDHNAGRHLSDIIGRFDLLDCLLWLIPPLVTIVVYKLLESRINTLLQPFLQGGIFS